MIVDIKPERAAELVEKLANFLVSKKMAAPSILFIESLRPLNFIGSQFMHLVGPFAELIFNAKEYQEVAALLEHTEYVDMLIKRIDQLDAEMYEAERAKSRLMRKRRMRQLKDFFKRLFKKQ